MSALAGPPSSSSPTTDPGVLLESLFRDFDPVSRRSRPTLRGYEPALRPPDDIEGFGWLYRPDPETPAIDARAASPASVSDAVAETSSGGVALAQRSPDTEGPAPALASAGPHWAPSKLPTTRRWPVLVMLAASLGSAALMAWLGSGGSWS